MRLCQYQAVDVTLMESVGKCDASLEKRDCALRVLLFPFSMLEESRRLKTVACWYANRLDRSFHLAPCPTVIPIAFTFAIPSQRNCLFYFPFALSFSFSFSAGSRHLLICIFQEANRRIGSGFQMSQVKAIFPPLPSPLFFYFSLSLSLFLFSLAGSLSLNVWCGTAQCGGAW